MKLYEFPINNQQIDLEQIESISEIIPVSFVGFSSEESFAYFTIFIKLGNSYNIRHYSGTHAECPQNIVDVLNKHRLDLIHAWEHYKCFAPKLCF